MLIVLFIRVSCKNGNKGLIINFVKAKAFLHKKFANEIYLYGIQNYMDTAGYSMLSWFVSEIVLVTGRK